MSLFKFLKQQLGWCFKCFKRSKIFASFRIIGSLLSAHLVLTNENPFHGNFMMADYDNELLTMAHDMASRILPAFDATKTGIFSHIIGDHELLKFDFRNFSYFRNFPSFCITYYRFSKNVENFFLKISLDLIIYPIQLLQF